MKRPKGLDQQGRFPEAAEAPPPAEAATEVGVERDDPVDFGNLAGDVLISTAILLVVCMAVLLVFAVWGK